MSSPTAAETLDAALERAVTRLGDGSATSEQIRQHFAFGEGLRRGERPCGELVVAVAQEEGAPPDAVLDVACAVTIVAASARVHVDLETEVAERGGRPTVWAQCGVAHGINAGDALAAVAYLALLDGSIARASERTIAMTHALNDAHLAACDAKARAIALGRTEALDVVPPALRAAACRLGALAAGASAARVDAYARLGAAAAETNLDALAEDAGIDRGGRVRTLLRETTRPLA
jgi:geranylgeranyl pyrophosphate synthase